MEKIKINSIDKKDTRAGKPFWVVNYNDNKEATVGDWHSQLANYIENDVGVGGSVSVLIEIKPNKTDPNKPYTNITSVDMTSAEKGELQDVKSVEQLPSDKPEKFRNPKEMNAMEMTKIRFRNAMTPTNGTIIDAYKWFLENL